MAVKKQYTVSTYVFDSLAEAEGQIRKWDKTSGVNAGTRVFEITGVVYEPVLKLVKSKKKV